MSLRLALKASLKDPPTNVPVFITPSKSKHRVNSHSSSRRVASRGVGKENVAPAVSRQDRLDARKVRIDIARHRSITTRTAEQEDELYPLEIEESLPDDENTAAAASARSATHNQSASKQSRGKRPNYTNWSKNPKMAEAVNEWLSSGPILDASGMKLSKRAFAELKGLPPTTFKYYVHDDPNKRRKLGIPPGRKPLISDQTSNVVCDVAVRSDRANRGLTPKELEATIAQVAPHLSQKQITNHRARTFRKKHKDRLKQKAVMPQKTSSRRSQTTVAQQYRWFQLYDKGLRFLLEKNTGLCNKTKKPF